MAEAPGPAPMRGRAAAIWAEAGGGDSSKRDARFYLEVLKSTGSHDEAWALLCALPGGKAAGGRRDAAYRESTARWASRQVEADALVCKQARRLRASEALLPEGVKLLCRYKELRPDKWRATLKRLGDKGLVRSEVTKAVARQASVEASASSGDYVRTAKSNKKCSGWWWRDADGWCAYPSHVIQAGLRGRGLAPDVVVAELMARPWTIVNVPFGPEEPGPRLWNKDAARFAVEPIEGVHPTWDQLLTVVGRSLDPYVGSGAGYLKQWVGSCFQRPLVKLPWLFLWGAEDCGKSTFAEALKLLLERGWADVRVAIESEQQFNREMAGSVVCVVEEASLKKGALERIKRWVTGETISIHEKGATPYDVVNSSHFVQAGNRIQDNPFKGGDTRVTALEVLPPLPSERMAKPVMMGRLKEEAPAFLWDVLHMALPEVVGRMGVPVVTTDEKRQQQMADRSQLEEWVEATADAAYMDDEEMVREFQSSLGAIGEWDKATIIRGEPAGHRRWRRVNLTLKKLAPWTGTATDLLRELADTAKNLSPEQLGLFLEKPNKWVVATKARRAKGVRYISLSPRAQTEAGA